MVKEFFDNVDNEIRNAQTKKTIQFLEKRAVRYVQSIPPSTNPKLIKLARSRLRRTRKLAKSYKKRVR